MFLYYYIFLGATVLTRIYGKSEQTVSNKHYKREVSLSYKYNLKQIYTTPKPHEYSNRRSLNKRQKNDVKAMQYPQQIYQSIVYAPLPLRIPDQNRKTHHTEIVTSAYDHDRKSIFKMDNVQKFQSQPQVLKDSNGGSQFVPYVSGHNIDLQAMNNKLIQSGIYANNPNLLVKNKQVNKNYYMTQSPYRRPDYKNFQSSNKYGGGVHGKERKKLQTTFYVKAPKVELNAHASKIARAPLKAPISVKTNFIILPMQPEESFTKSKIIQPRSDSLRKQKSK